MEKKTVKAKAAVKPVSEKKTREEIENMFSMDFSCDCSRCEHHCGDAE
ncbi:MAG: hypothetical protein Q8Q67_00755 [bacterium]|nr:hypothetical protein [bacterium]